MTIAPLRIATQQTFQHPHEDTEKQPANRIMQDLFSHATMEFSSAINHAYRNRNYVAVLGTHCSGARVATLSLWNLITKSKLWEVKLQNNDQASFGNCHVSDNGMVIVETRLDPPPRPWGLFKWPSQLVGSHGERYADLPKLHWTSYIPVGEMVLCTWQESRRSESSNVFWFLPTESHCYFGELDPKTNQLSRVLIDHTKGRWNHRIVCDTDYWVRLTGSASSSAPSLLEVFYRSSKFLKSLPLDQSSYESEFSSACIVHDQLIYGKNIVQRNDEGDKVLSLLPSLMFLDLTQCNPTGSIGCSEMGQVKFLAANSIYIAWLLFQGEPQNRVQYLDRRDNDVIDSELIPYCKDNPEVSLDITGSCLSVIYAEESTTQWCRLAIDLRENQLKQKVIYTTSPFKKCSMYNGQLLTTHNNGIYIESFTDV
jgi:hypothetical protein